PPYLGRAAGVRPGRRDAEGEVVQDRAVVADHHDVRQVGTGPDRIEVLGRARVHRVESDAAIGRDGDGTVRARGPEVAFAVAIDAVERLGRARIDGGPGDAVIGRMQDDA